MRIGNETAKVQSITITGKAIASPEAMLPTGSSDKADLSQIAKEAAAALQAIRSAPDVRTDRINAVKQKLAEDKEVADTASIVSRLLGSASKLEG